MKIIKLLLILLLIAPIVVGADSIVLPYGALSINQGESKTASQYVDLKIYATQGGYEITKMSFSNNGESWSAWEDIAEDKENWDITDEEYGGSENDVEKTVYARLRDSQRTVSETFTDKIIYDTTPPITTANPVAGVYSYLRAISLETNEDGCTTYYTLDGTEPTEDSDIYEHPFIFLTDQNLKYFSIDSVGNEEIINISQYNFIRIVTVPANNAPAHIRQFDLTGHLEETELAEPLFAFDNENFRGGANIATGDVDGDTQDEIIVAPAQGMKPIIEIYDKDGEKKLIEYISHSSDYMGGVDVAAADLDGDGMAEIIAVNTSVTETDRDVARVKVYKYDIGRTLITEFNAFGGAIAGGRVTAGDIDNDGLPEIIVSANNHGGPIVRAFEMDGSPRPTQFFTFHTDYHGGIDVAAGDVDGNGKKDEIAVIPLANEISKVKIYRWRDDQYIVSEFKAFSNREYGGNIEMGDIDQDGIDEILVGTQQPVLSRVKAFEADGTLISSIKFYAYPKIMQIGVSVAILDF